MQDLDPLDRWGQSDEPHTPRTTLCLKMQHPSHPDYEDKDKRFRSFWNSLKHPNEQSNQLLFPCISHDMSRKRATESGATFSFVVVVFFFGDYIQQIPPFQLNKETRNPKWLTCFEMNKSSLKCAGFFKEVQTKDTELP